MSVYGGQRGTPGLTLVFLDPFSVQHRRWQPCEAGDLWVWLLLSVAAAHVPGLLSFKGEVWVSL